MINVPINAARQVYLGDNVIPNMNALAQFRGQQLQNQFMPQEFASKNALYNAQREAELGRAKYYYDRGDYYQTHSDNPSLQALKDWQEAKNAYGENSPEAQLLQRYFVNISNQVGRGVNQGMTWTNPATGETVSMGGSSGGRPIFDPYGMGGQSQPGSSPQLGQSPGAPNMSEDDEAAPPSEDAYSVDPLTSYRYRGTTAVDPNGERLTTATTPALTNAQQRENSAKEAQILVPEVSKQAGPYNSVFGSWVSKPIDETNYLLNKIPGVSPVRNFLAKGLGNDTSDQIRNRLVSAEAANMNTLDAAGAQARQSIGGTPGEAEVFQAQKQLFPWVSSVLPLSADDRYAAAMQAQALRDKASSAVLNQATAGYRTGGNESAPQRQSGTVQILAPDGKIRSIPADQVNAALKAGGKRV